MKVEYETDYELAINGATVLAYELPKCPACKGVPTYNMNPCPYCGQELEYPEGVTVIEDKP